MNEKLIEAFWHCEHWLFGRRLRPLTLRHCFVLATAGNPLIVGGSIPTTGDLIQAVEICSRDSRFFLSGKKPGWLSRQLIGVRATLGKRSLDKFLAYLADYCARPEIWQSQGGKSARVHWTLSTVAGLAHYIGLPPETAWEMSPGEADWLLAAAIEQCPHASIDLVSDAEREAIARLRGKEAA